MSDAVNALGSAIFAGPFASVEELPVQGMVTLRGDLTHATFAKAVQNATGCDLPERRSIFDADGISVAWMSPDEVLFLMPYGESADVVAKLTRALSGMHHLAVDVSDARAVFCLSGEGAREVLARLAPADLSPAALPPGEVRRTRLAQVPGAFWFAEDGSATIVCFRSVARYVCDILSGAAAGEPVGFLNA